MTLGNALVLACFEGRVRELALYYALWHTMYLSVFFSSLIYSLI